MPGRPGGLGPAARLLYAAAAQTARGLAHLAPDSERKLWRALRARRGIRARYSRWGRAERDDRRPLLWVHAPSVGEGLQARPLLGLVQERLPDVQLAYTFFSPSAASFARTLDTDFADYLPFDTAGDASVALDALRPSALVFSKLDVWPVLAREASDRGVPLGLVSATLAAGSSRESRFAGRLLGEAYARLDAVGAIDADDAGRLMQLGVRPEVLRITGDTRYDQVWARAQGVDREGPLLLPLRSERPTLVAGSTWPADERVLLPAWETLRTRFPAARLIIAPHEPTEAHLTPIERWAASTRLRLARLSRADAESADVLLVDRVGVLGDLYALADASFVGGAFHAAGLHSVLEPAAFGAPVLFGPAFSMSRDARRLQEAGGGGPVSGAAELAHVLGQWLDDEARRRETGARARGLVESGLGAAERSYDLVRELLAR